MMKNEFSNGLIGHRVEGYDLRNMVKVQGIALQFIAPYPECDVPSYLVMLDDGVISWACVDRVILPVNEPPLPLNDFEKDLFGIKEAAMGAIQILKTRREHLASQKPAEPYDLNNMDHLRKIETLLKESGFEVDAFPPYAYMVAIKQDHTVYIDGDGACLTNKGVRMSPNIPLNEWVKNPTIESLMPQKQD